MKCKPCKKVKKINWKCKPDHCCKIVSHLFWDKPKGNAKFTELPDNCYPYKSCKPRQIMAIKISPFA